MRYNVIELIQREENRKFSYFYKPERIDVQSRKYNHVNTIHNERKKRLKIIDNLA